MPLKKLIVTMTLSAAAAWPPQPFAAQNAPATPLAATASTAVPALIPYSGSVALRDGKPLPGESGITVLIFKQEQGGEPLFTETQTVVVDATGHYKIQLGASRSSGIPVELFASGEARWLEVQVAGEEPQPRVLLASVPYALKAADAATLGGLPASAFALAGSGGFSGAGPAGSPAPNANSTVTTPGGTCL